MTSIHNRLLKALSDALWYNTFSSNPTDVLEEAQLQAVAGLLNGEDLYTATRFVQYCYVEDELVKLLSSHNIPTVIVKGTSAAIYYPIHSARTFGDIDFIVPPQYFSTATTLLEANGYERSSKIDQLLESILTSGNFGIKTGTGNSIEITVSTFKREGLFRYLQRAGEHN